MANSATVGSAVIRLTFDGKNAKAELAGIEKNVESSGSKIGNTFSKVGKMAVAGFAVASTAAAGMAVSITKSAVQGFAEYEQLVGGIDTLFKDSSDIVQKYASQAYKTAQISANEYMDTVTSFSARLLQGLGGDTAKAAEIANTAVIDMSDNANKMGTSIEMIQNAYQGFAKQNYTMLDNLKLGYGGTASEMARLINDSGVLGDTMTVTANTVNSVSFDKMIEAIHVVQENMGITGTSALEASKTVQGSINSMKSAWSDLVTGMANENADVGVLIENFVDSAGTALENLIPVIFSAMENIAGVIDKITPMITEKLPALIQTLAPTFINVVMQIAIALVQSLPTVLTTLLQGFLNALPALISAIVDAIPQIIIAIIEFLTNPDNIALIVEAAIQLFMGLVMAVPQILGGLISAFGTLVGNLWNGITKMFGEFAGKFGEFIGGIFKGAINGVLTFIENFINAPIDLLNGFIGLINDAFGWIGVNIGKIDRIQLPRLATGGIALSATTAIIGEQGKEAVLPLENNTDNWAGLLANTLVNEMEAENLRGGGDVIQYNTIEIRNEMDAQDIGRVLMQSIRRTA